MKKSPSKTFRLFISSTFSDFKEERNILQTEVFPIVKTYAVKQGYTFQPIDLRWGVNNEAQLDQKALELCLSEVKACKTHMYPNFLIMAGDRYGWVPLPYAIEKEEFDTIYNKSKEKKLLDDWYKLDKNQLPSSYMLQKREGKYKDYNIWVVIENKLRDILQKGVELANLPETQRRKYFLSATEAEVEEGIIPYHKPTEFQASTLLKENPDLVKIDPKHIFGFLREVDMESKQGNMFIPNKEEWEKAGEFKDRLRENITSENILEVTTKQTDKKHLDIAYLKKFKERIIEFLKNQIDTHKQQESERNYSALEIELQAQNYYAINKGKGFLQTKPLKNLLSDINNYVDYREKSEPFILYGASGRGKSALMAQAIDEVQNRLKERVVYRFIGATPYANSSQEILISIFDELGIDIRSQEQKDFQKNNESFEEFSNRVYHTIINFDKDVVIFIDALDQLQNDDQFLWLPKLLPANVKIILSCLNDENYKDDTKYFNTLQEKFANLYEIPPFNEPTALLKELLKEENRTLSEDQENDFLKQYEKVNAPLYIVMASREIKTWRSDETSQTLASTQKGIIEEFIVNLTKVHNHDEKFVHKVLGYIYASRDGVSESELLELLATDEKFIEHVAPETFHENPNHELPLSHWSRLQTEFKPFFSIKEQDNEELMYFFHREFEDAVANQEQQQEEHKAIIKATQKKIVQNQDQEFDENRWGRLYITLITEYELRYNDKAKQQEFAKFIANTKHIKKDWIEKCILEMETIGYAHYQYNRMLQTIVYREISKYILESLHQEDPERWVEYYINSLNDLAYSYFNHNRLQEALNLSDRELELSKELYEDDSEKWVATYLESLYAKALFLSYQNHYRFEGALNLSREALEISEKLYEKDPERWAVGYTSLLVNAASYFRHEHYYDYALELIEKALKISEEFYEKDPTRWMSIYIVLLASMGDFHKDQNRLDKAIELGQRALKISEEFYEKDPARWVADYISSLNKLIDFYGEQNRFGKVQELTERIFSISEELYGNDSERWGEDNIESLRNRVYFYANHNRLDEAIELTKRALKIIEEFYKKDPKRWVEDYIAVLTDLSKYYDEKQFHDKAIDLAERALEIAREESFLNMGSNYAWDLMPSIHLAHLYAEVSLIDEAIELLESVLDSRKPRYVRGERVYNGLDRSASRENYIIILTHLAHLYAKENHFDKAIELNEEALEVNKEPDDMNYVKWATSYVTTLAKLADFYSQQNYFDKAIELTERALIIIKELYEKDSARWGEEYIQLFDSLSTYYDEKQQRDKAIELAEKALKKSEELYEEEPGRWVELYAGLLNRLAYSYAKYNRSDESVEIAERALKTIEPFYQKDPARWVNLYTTLLGHQAKQYTLGKVIELAERALKISEELYEKDPTRWAKDYIVVLYHFSILFFYVINDVKTSIRLAKKQYEISKQHKDCDTMDALIIYLFMLSKSRLVWGIIAFMIIGIIFVILYFN